ncbi:MAG: iron-sulfur cluster assembly scaffold protein [Anaerolineae bacterium]|jgi:nitrogen fixation NifU-like protein|nr:iron-sulfur cluster assembly scaffold protein [Anaerolineae bacterium]
MEAQKIRPQNETSSHEIAGEKTWSGGDASLSTIELRPVTFSAKAIQHGRHPTNAGRMEDPDASASRVGWCGEMMELYLRLDGDRITEASFWADGCLSTMACGDMLTTIARGMTLEGAAAITPEQLIAALDGLPYKSHHCAELSVETLREAIAGRPGR